MTTLPTVIALVALVGLAVVWLRLQTLNKTVAYLEHVHGPAGGSKPVEFKGISLPAATFSDAITSRAVVAEPLIILGFRTLYIDLGNQSNGHNVVTKDFVIDVPAGTSYVLPSLIGFCLLFGKITVNPDGTESSVSVEDHHLGLEAMVVDVAALGGGTATLRAHAVLSDKNGDDKWSGIVYASVIFLGRSS